jgi:uncharacterized protein YndB with AHSA1/START domain
MIDVVEHVLIDRTPGEVWGFIATPGSLARWSSTVERVDSSPAAPEAGARITGVAKVLGRSFEFEIEITAAEPGKVLEGRSTTGPFPYRLRYELTAAGDSTRFEYHMESDGFGGFFGKLGDPMAARRYRRQLQKDLHTLKQLVEAET